MQKKLAVEIGALRLTPMGVEAKGIAKIDGEQIEIKICGEQHHMNPDMNWNESALICRCEEEEKRQIVEHPLMRARLAEAKAMLLEEMKGDLRLFLEHLALVEAAKQAPSTSEQTSEQGRGCKVTRLEIKPANIYGAAESVYAESTAIAEVTFNHKNVELSIHLSAQMEEDGETITILFTSKTEKSAHTEFDCDEWEEADATLNAHPELRETLEQMRRDVIDVARASARQELNRLESIETAESRT